MGIGYTIESDQFKVLRLSESILEGAPLNRTIEKSGCPVSVLHITGEIHESSSIFFEPTSKTGILCCIQHVSNGRIVEFNSASCNEINYHKEVVEVRLSNTNTGFKHCYSTGSVLSRVDLFFPEKSLQLLNNRIKYSLLHLDHVAIELSHSTPGSKKIRNILIKNMLGAEQISATADKFIRIVNILFK
jgi:hypothetical protein